MVTSVAIIILNWNQAELTIDTLSSFLKIKANKFSYHIYLVDNASTDDSFLKFKKFYKIIKN